LRYASKAGTVRKESEISTTSYSATAWQRQAGRAKLETACVSK